MGSHWPRVDIAGMGGDYCHDIVPARRRWGLLARAKPMEVALVD